MENKAFHHGSAQQVAQAHQAPRQSDLEDLEGPVFYAKKSKTYKKKGFTNGIMIKHQKHVL